MDYGVVIDLETTGLDAGKDRIIEVGMLEFTWDGQHAPVLTEIYGGLQDPKRPLTPEISALTGLTDEQLQGAEVDWERIRKALARSQLVVAHNAAFDAGFLANCGQLDGLKLHWACSSRHIDWKAHGFGTRALNYLAADHGFVNPFAHRAVFDCATTFRLIQPHMAEMVERSFATEYCVWAEGAPFESKDKLKERGYRWDAAQRVWSRVLTERELQEERDFLRTEVYTRGGSAGPREERLPRIGQ